eukprot:3031799-Rhodomonas_salina.1
MQPFLDRRLETAQVWALVALTMSLFCTRPPIPDPSLALPDDILLMHTRRDRRWHDPDGPGVGAEADEQPRYAVPS